MKRSPLKRTPMKRTPKKRATAAERRHMDRLAQMGCLICGGPAEIHHLTSDGMKRITRSNARTAPLCMWHHRLGEDAVERISQRAFNERFDIDLLAWADEQWRISTDG